MSEIKKVTLTKEQAEAIELAKERDDIDRIVNAASSDKPGWYAGKYVPLNSLTLETLMTALVNGYEVEKTPEEKVREYYEEIDSYRRQSKGFDSNASDEFHRMCDAIRTTLDLLGIKIEGVNA
ncbi:hypothetical protein HYI36_20310 [Bacillus sp. Gen3]|nr:hypothetical protein [Bacillus sp. Gen3]